jgi:hypothetical protein
MAVSLYQLAQRVQRKTGKGTWNEVIADVRSCYAFVVKNVWFENKKMDIGELDGSFIIPFYNQMPILDTTTNLYSVDLQSNYVQLPQEGGLVSVSYMNKPNTNFVLVNAGTASRLSNIKAGVMGGRQTYYVLNTKMYFPNMNNTTNLPVLVKLGCAIDNYDVDATINISPNLQEQIVDMCIAKYIQPNIDEPINAKIK